MLESRVSGLVSTRAGEKATLNSLERKLADERKQKTEFQVRGREFRPGLRPYGIH